MSKRTAKVTSTKELKEKNDIQIQNEMPEIINNIFLNESSIIVHEIIEKIISLVISSDFKNNVEKQISSSCFDFIKETLDSFLSCTFIPHDKDETYHESFNQSKNDLILDIEPISIRNDFSNQDINNNSHSKSNLKLDEQIYYNNYFHGDNDWDLMGEPQSNHYDRYASTMLKMKEIQKEKVKYQKKGEVLEEVDEESEKNSVNNNNEKKDININRTELHHKTKKIKEENISNNINNSNDNRVKKKNLYDIMNQFSFHDLDNNDDIYKEPKDIDYENLRLEADEKQKAKNEEKKVNKNAKNKIENILKLDAEKKRQYIGKKITVDPNGEIVFIRGIRLDKLKKDFVLLKTATKLVRDEEKEKEKEREREKKKKKKNKSQEEIPQDKNKEEVEKNKIIDNTNQNKNQKIKGTKVLPKIKNKFRTLTKENNIEDINRSRLLKKIEEGPIIPSGSNFEIMNMEVGVSLKENEKFKTGGKDFYHKFNKYSLANYNKQLKETTEMNSFLKTHEEIENPMTKTDINYLGNLTEAYNSSMGFLNKSNINQLMTSPNKNYLLTNFNTLSNFGVKSSISLNKTKNLNSSLSPKLKLEGKNTSLLGTMERLNLISERQEKLAKKTVNLFKKGNSNYSSASHLLLPKLEEVNKFTSEILTSSNWMAKNGVNNNIGAPFRNPGKPGNKEISREMGIKGKILRNRIKNNPRDRPVPFALETVDFFKK